MNAKEIIAKADRGEGLTVEEIKVYQQAVKPVKHVYGKYGTLALKYLEEHNVGYGLCWEDIDFNNKTISINRQVQWMQDKERDNLDKVQNNGTAECGKGYWYFCPPKYKSYRQIEISDNLANMLFKEQAKQTRAKEYYNIYYTDYYVEQPLTFDAKPHNNQVSVNKISTQSEGFPVHLVMVRDNGTFISPRTTQHFSRIIKKEICPEFDFHSLRKTHASMLNEMGVDQKYIQTRLGHTNIDMTINVYETTTDIMRARGRKAINMLFD